MTIRLEVVDQHGHDLFSRKWKLGSCYGPIGLLQYKDKQKYWDRCCLTPGVYTLICSNDRGPYGWGNSFIEILGQRYCDDFVGFKGFRRVIVTST